MGISMDISMDIPMDIHEKKSVDMDVAMDGKFHIHGNPAKKDHCVVACNSSIPPTFIF